MRPERPGVSRRKTPASPARRSPPPRRAQRHGRLIALVVLAVVAAATVAGFLLLRHSDDAPPQAAAASPAVPQASVEDLLALPRGGDWQARRLRGNRAVLVIQFPGLRAQGRTLNRAAALLEKSGGRRDKVLTDDELRAALAASDDSEASYFLGHDYRAEDLGRFFTMAQAQQVQLNAEELRLRQLLQDAGVLKAGAAGRFDGAPAQALVTFSAEQPDDPATPQDESIDARRRESVLRHELSHGLYFTDTRYRDHCWRFWRELLSEQERGVWRNYLSSLGYDAGNEDLMVNEMQALLMHTPDKRDFDAPALGMAAPALEGLRARFRLGLRVPPPH